MLDIDRDRQRISLGLKQTQEDPWQRVVDTYHVGDELEGTVTKVVTFGAFVEILDGVEGLVHISELAPHHVENPREIVQPGDEVRVKILEIDSERRRLSLSVKRVEGQVLPASRRAGRRRVGAGGDLDDVPELGLSEDVFAEPAPAEAPPADEPAPRGWARGGAEVEADEARGGGGAAGREPRSSRTRSWPTSRRPRRRRGRGRRAGGRGGRGRPSPRPTPRSRRGRTEDA